MKTTFATSLCALALSLSSALAERNYLAWQQRAGSDIGSTYRAVATTVTNSGHTVVAGYNDLLQNDTWQVVNYDALTGNVRWAMSKSSASGDVRPSSIVSESNGHIYVGGFTSSGNSHDFLVIKYDGNDGTELWSKTYNNAATNGSDEITAMAIDNYGNVTVTGGSYNNGSEDFYTIKYNSAGGVAWERRYATSFQDRPVAVAIGPQSEVVVVGKSRLNGANTSSYATVKYDSDGNGQTVQSYDTAYNDVPSDVAIDSAGNIYVTGNVQMTSPARYVVHTVKYGSNPWTKTYDAPGENSDWAPKIAIGPDDVLVLACTSRLDNLSIVYRAAKYHPLNGAEIWSQNTSVLPGRTASVTDTVVAMKVDPIGDVIITGDTHTVNGGTDYLTVNFSGIDGRVLWQQQQNGDATAGLDQAATLALSPTGDVVVTGMLDRGDANSYYSMGTVRYNRLALSKGDRVSGLGLTPAAIVNSLGSPSFGPYSEIVTKTTIKDGSKVLNAILRNLGGNNAEVMQGQAAPGVLNAKFSTFSDPVGASSGYAFVATLTGAPTGQTSGLWTTGFIGKPLTLVMQTGKQAPALPSGVLVSSIVNFAPSYDSVVVMVTLKGTGVTTANNSAVIRCGSAASSVLMRTGTGLMVGGKVTQVKTISIFSPPFGSAGHGRYVGHDKVTMKLTMTNASTVVTTVQVSTNTLYFQAVSGGPADAVAMGATWLNFTQPCISKTDKYHAFLGALKTGVAGVTTANDSAIVIADNTNTSFTTLAREASPAKNIPNATYASLGVPVSGPYGWYAFQGTIKGTGVTTSNNSGIWYGGGAASYGLLARTSATAPDAFGAPSTRQYASFKTIAMAWTPLFCAKLKGTGVTTANNSALFAMDSDSRTRQILRTGDKMGPLTIRSFSLLNPTAKAMSATRSFNSIGDVTALVTFTDLSQSIIHINLP